MGACLMCDRPAPADVGLCAKCEGVQDGNLIREHVEATGRTLEQIAEDAQVSKRSVMRAAAGKKISGRTALAIARAMSVNVREVLALGRRESDGNGAAGR